MIRDSLLADALPKTPLSAEPAILDASSAEDFYAGLSIELQAQVMDVLSIILNKNVMRSDFSDELKDALAEMFRVGLISSESFDVVRLTEPDLLIVWPRLELWIREQQGLLAARANVAYQCKRWAQAGRHPTFLLTGTDLLETQGHLRENPLCFTKREIEYIRLSSTHGSEDPVALSTAPHGPWLWAKLSVIRRMLFR